MPDNSRLQPAIGSLVEDKARIALSKLVHIKLLKIENDDS